VIGAGSETISAMRCFDVLQVTFAEIGDFAVELRRKLVANRRGDHRLAGSSKCGKASREIDAVTVERNVVGQDVGDVDADTEQNALVDVERSRHVGRVAMKRKCAFGGVTRVREVDHQSIAQPLQKVTAMGGHDFIRRFEQQLANPARGADLVLLNEAH